MPLFEPFTLGNLRLKNRVVMAPLTRSRCEAGNLPGPLTATYYGQRSGAGLIVTEGTSPAPEGLGYARIPGIFSDGQVEGWRRVADQVHAGGSHLFMQLMHTGRVSHRSNLPAGAEVVAPSAVPLPGEVWSDTEGMQPYTPPRAMSLAEIAGAQQAFARAARNALAAGCDGVELHGANGYLVEQFIHPHTNRRTDAYGGSVENRARFLLETLEGMIEAVGREQVGVRLSPYGVFNDMPHYPEIDATYGHIARQLERLGVVYVHLVDHSAMGAPPVPETIKQAIREAYGGVLILCGGYDRPSAEAALEAGAADLVAFGRPFIANPDLVERMARDIALAEPDPATFYTPGARGYTDYPFAAGDT